jgi:hypothetical protein
MVKQPAVVRVVSELRTDDRSMSRGWFKCRFGLFASACQKEGFLDDLIPGWGDQSDGLPEGLF